MYKKEEKVIIFIKEKIKFKNNLCLLLLLCGLRFKIEEKMSSGWVLGGYYSRPHMIAKFYKRNLFGFTYDYNFINASLQFTSGSDN